MPMISLAAIQCTELVAEFSVMSLLHSIKAAMVSKVMSSESDSFTCDTSK